MISCAVEYVHPQEDETNTLVEMGGGRGERTKEKGKKNKRQDTV